MPSPNGLNPSFIGKVEADGFDAIHGKGVSSTVITLSGTTAADLFAAANGFKGTITGLLFVALTGTSSTVTVTSRGDTVATITAGTTNGAVTGPAGALNNTVIALGATAQVSSNDPLEAGSLIVWYKVTA